MCKFLRAFPVFILIVAIPAGYSFASGPLDGANERITRIRTREVRVRLVDAQGQPLKKTPVDAEMVRHQFLFGCNFYMYEKFKTPRENELYEKMWIGLFNYGTVPFYFSYYQHSAAMEDSEKDRVKAMTRWLIDHGAVVKGHPLIWHFPGISPKWLPEDPEQTGRIVGEWIQSVVKQYPEIKYWDVLNEPTTIWFYDTKVGKWEQSIGPIETARRGIEWAGKSSPDAGLLINDYNVMFNLWSFVPLFKPLRLTRLAFDGKKDYPYSYMRYLKKLMKIGVKFDAVGLQSHMHMGNWPMHTVWRVCRRYSKLGLPLHFTEVTVLSGEHKIMQPHNPEKNMPWISTEEGERKQADYVEKFYTLLFSHPSVQAITWWDLTDYQAWMGAPAGLLRADLSPKPAYERLKKLIKGKWWTHAEGQTDENGYYTFRAFCGDYKLTVGSDPKPEHFTVDCSTPENQAIDIRSVI